MADNISKAYGDIQEEDLDVHDDPEENNPDDVSDVAYKISEKIKHGMGMTEHEKALAGTYLKNNGQGEDPFHENSEDNDGLSDDSQISNGGKKVSGRLNEHKILRTIIK